MAIFTRLGAAQQCPCATPPRPRPRPAPATPDVDSGVDKCYVNVRHFSISCHTQLQLHYSTSVFFYIYTSSNLYQEVQLDVMTDDLSAF